MTDLNIEVDRSGRRRSHKVADNPIGLLASIIAQNPKAPVAVHIAEFIRLMRLDGYEDYADALAEEWCRIKYTTARLAAVPPTAEEIEERRKQRLEAKKAEAAAIARAKLKIVGKVLETKMANGKKLGDCTGVECKALGGWLTRVGDVVGTKLVREVLSNRQVMQLVVSK